MFSRNTKSTADIGQRLMNGVIGRKGKDNSTGKECVMRAVTTAGAAVMNTEIIHFVNRPVEMQVLY